MIHRALPKFGADMLFVLVLLTLFALVASLLVGAGAGVYAGIADTGGDLYEARTSLSFVANKIRYSEGRTADLRVFGGTEAIVIPEQVDGDTYLTLIYYRDGALCELYAAADRAIDLSLGEEIVELEGFRAERDGDLLRLTAVTTRGREAALSLCAPAAPEVP